MQIRNFVTSTPILVLLAAAGVANTASLNNADKQFLDMAAKTDMTEAHEGQMAENQGTRGDIKSFGQTLVTDHSADYTKLSELAAKTGVTIPTGINVAQDRDIVQLEHLTGNQFDHQFTTDEIAAHRRVLATYKREAKDGHDADVKAYASQMIPTLEKHLQLAEQCAKPEKHS